MKKYKVLVEFELNNEKGTSEFHVEAEGVHFNSDWLTFDSGTMGKSNAATALFPRERIIAVVPDE